MTKILFSTPIGPYRTHAWNNSLTDLQEQRFSMGQDIFTFRGHMHCPALHTLAQNISPPSVVLEYPRWDNFEHEVRKGYDYIGISFMHNHVDVVMEMCKRARTLSPQTKIILGWHGARGIAVTYPEDKCSRRF